MLQIFNAAKSIDVGSQAGNLLSKNAAQKKVLDKNKEIQNKKNTQTATLPGDAENVFGSFGLTYPVSGIEKERADGVTIINYSPECRVFICGGEVTKDVTNVTVQYTSDNMSSCTINLANPRGKYNISISDLVGGKNGSLWREDKSIQATYDYDWLKKQVPGTWSGLSRDSSNVKQESKLTQVGNAFLGKQITATFNSVVSGIKNMSRNRQKGFTQMLYEVKQESNLHKAIGETVFDYRDTVYVFFKGRFSTYWYFGFSGIVSSIDNNFSYGSVESISLQCNDIIGILKRKKFTQQASVLRAATLEEAQKASTTERAFNIFGNLKGTFSTVVKTIMYVSNENYVNAVENSHFYYSDKCTLRKMGYDKQSPRSSKDTENQKIELAAEPYAATNLNKYYTEFFDTHKFNMKHTDDQIRDNINKQFREFKLKPDVSRGGAEVKPIELTAITFKSASILYTGQDNKKVIPQAVKEKLKGIIDILADIVNNSKTKISWTVVGHNDFRCGKNIITPKSETAKAIQEKKIIADLDLGPTLMEYGPYLDPTYNCLNVKEKTKIGDYSYEYGLGVTLSKNRAKTVLADLTSEAKLLSQQDADKYSGVYNLLSSLTPDNNTKGVGTTEPRDKTGAKVAKRTYTTIDQAIADFGNLFSAEQNSPANEKNRYMELVPDVKSYEVKKDPQANNSGSFIQDPHSLRFSPLTDIYFQFNEININDFTPANLKVFYDTSVRYWVKGPGTSLDIKNLGDNTKTGWQHTHGFGVCGIHPALTYEFIDNFNILPDVHAVLQNNEKALDGTTLSPLDVLREQVYGVGTELSNSALVSNSSSIGTQHNYFRPRIFLVVPKKFRERERFSYEFSGFDLVKVQAMNTWDMLDKLILDHEYTIYSSPMGDLFIEPLMHDFHPLDFCGKIEERPICTRKRTGENNSWEYQGVDVFFRTTIHTNNSPIIAYRKDKAYKFNTKANHPFFITNKDLKRVTDTIKPENLLSHVILDGSVTGENGIIEGAVADKINAMGVQYVDIESHVMATSTGNTLRLEDSTTFGSKFDIHQGIYIANGFNRMTQSNATFKMQTDQQIKEKSKTYDYKVLNNFLKYKQESSIGSLIINAEESLQKLKNSSFLIANKKLAQLIENFTNSPTYYPPELDPKMATEGSLTASQIAVLYSLCPSLFDLYNYVYNEQINSVKNIGNTINGGKTDVPEIINAHNITNLSGAQGLLKLLVSTLTYKPQDVTLNSKKTNNDQIDELTTSLTQDTLYNEATVNVLKDLKDLYEVIILADTLEDSRLLRDLSTEIALLNKKSLNQGMKMDGFITRGDLKTYENLQMYDPSKDNVSKYGWNPGPTVQNKFINDGAAAETYCKVLFDKINAKAFELNCDIIGRPELCLNRPYYVEKNASIGLCTDYSINYSSTSPFASNVKLTYLRRNALSYNYTLGNLDRISSLVDSGAIKAHTNQYFNEKALNFFKSIFNQDKSVNRMNTINDVVSKAPEGGVAGLLIGGASQVFLKNQKDKAKEVAALEEDGIYVAHDWIGHIDYDEKYGIVYSELFKEKIKSDSSENIKYVAQLAGHIITTKESQDIVAKNNELHSAFMILQNIERELELNHSAFLKSNDNKNKILGEIDEINNILADDTLSSTDRATCNRELSSLQNKYLAENAYYISYQDKALELNNSHIKLTTQIYGQSGTYTPASTAQTNSYNYVPSAINRHCTWLKSAECLMSNLFYAIPLKDVNGQTLRDLSVIIDDTTTENTQELTGKQTGIPLYILVKNL